MRNRRFIEEESLWGRKSAKKSLEDGLLHSHITFRATRSTPQVKPIAVGKLRKPELPCHFCRLIIGAC